MIDIVRGYSTALRRRVRHAARALMLIALCAAATVGSAAPDPVMRRGFSPDGVYDVSGIDAVDLYTGNLTVQIPIGQKYQSNGALAYQFKLTYNSSLWDYWDQSAPTLVGNVTSHYESFVQVSTWDREDGGGFAAQEALPSRSSNAGLGWRVSLGDVEGGLSSNGLVIRYVDDSGNAHTFYSTLHGNLNTDSETLTGDGPFFARDGSYLRLRRKDDGALVKVEIDSPDGVIRRFSCPECSKTGVSARRWNLDEIVDQYGNALVITRRSGGVNSPTRPPEGQYWDWTFTEKAGDQDGYPADTSSLTTVRTHTARFRVARVYRVNGYDAAAEVLLEDLTLAVCCESTSTAKYTFNYGTPKDVYRPPQSNWIGPTLVIPTLGDGYIRLYALRSVVLPAVTNPETQSDVAGRWEFAYLGDDPGDDLHKIPGDSVRAATSDYSGHVKSIRYPTGGGMRYEYRTRAFIKVACDPNAGGPITGGRFQRFLAVGRRQPFDHNGANVGRGWSYTFAKYDLAVGELCGQIAATKQPKDVTSAVIDPMGKATVTYFSNFVGNDHAGSAWTHTELGLPFTKHEVDPLDATRFLSEEVYDCSASTIADPTAMIGASIARSLNGAAPACAGPLRKTYVRFENSGVACDLAAGRGNCSNAGRRIASTRTEYRDFCSKDNSPYCIVNPLLLEHRWVVRDYSNFDGLGHYRTEKVSGNFYDQAYPEYAGRVSADQRSTTTWYNHGTTFDAATKVFAGRSLSAADTRWLLETYTFTKVTAFDTSTGLWKTQYTHYRFDDDLQTGTGQLLGWRRLRKLGGADTHTDASRGDSLRDGEDVMMRQVRARTTGAGLGKAVSVTSAYYGGSVQKGLLSGSLDAALPVNTDFAIRTTLAFGSTARSEYVCGNEAFLLIEQNVVNANTGLVTSSKDAWGAVSNAASSFGYDALGRLVSAAAPGEAAMTYKYPFMTNPASEWAVIAKQQSADGAGTRTQDYVFDALGRLKDTRRSIEGGTGRIRRTYGDDQLVASTSNETGADGPFHDTTYRYDVFGRPVTTDRPGGGNSVFMKYYGIQRAQTKTEGVAISPASTAAKASTSYVDVFGRTIKIDDAEGFRTTYSYDYADRLTGVEMDNQKRKFVYDGRGFLTDESMPELLHQSIEYSDLDSRGNPGKRRYYSGTPDAKVYSPLFELRYLYDRAERLVAVNNSAGKSVKTFGYDKGRLKTAGRSNDIPDPQAEKLGSTERLVTTIFDYDTAGRMNKKTLSAGFTAAATFPSNDFSQVKTIAYPQIVCAKTSECLATGPVRTVTHGYNHGFLDGVSLTAGPTVQTLISSIDYHPNGLWAAIARGNTTTEKQEIQNGYARPYSITAQKGASSLWTSSSMLYDGYDNVKAIGADTFSYDGLGRLTAASLQGTAQTLAYDRFGNITTMSTGGVATTFGQVQLNGSPSNRIGTIGGVAVQYDLAGNMTQWKDPRRPNYEMTLSYDEFNMVKHSVLKNPEGKREFGRVFMYDASDERVAVVDYVLKGADAPTVRETWSLRGAANQVLRDAVREKNRNTGAWSWRWSRDYVYRDGSLIAEIVAPSSGAEIVRHMHLDHLGSVRAVTETNGVLREQRKYYPFGEPLASVNPTSRMAFAGHERDDDQSSSPYSDLDYMHARYYSPVMGRFLSTDPARGRIDAPQSWNRYAYAANTPLSAIDPDGRETFYINRHLQPLGGGAQSRRNAVTHSFIATTSGGQLHTYSWGNESFVHATWFADRPEDLAAARAAIESGLAQHIGDDSLDPFIALSYESARLLPGHVNMGFLQNCKFEALMVIGTAHDLSHRFDTGQPIASFNDEITVTAPPLEPVPVKRAPPRAEYIRPIPSGSIQ